MTVIYGAYVNAWLVIIPFGLSSLSAAIVCYRALERLTNGNPWSWL